MTPKTSKPLWASLGMLHLFTTPSQTGKWSIHWISTYGRLKVVSIKELGVFFHIMNLMFLSSTASRLKMSISLQLIHWALCVAARSIDIFRNFELSLQSPSIFYFNLTSKSYKLTTWKSEEYNFLPWCHRKWSHQSFQCPILTPYMKVMQSTSTFMNAHSRLQAPLFLVTSISLKSCLYDTSKPSEAQWQSRAPILPLAGPGEC